MYTFAGTHSPLPSLASRRVRPTTTVQQSNGNLTLHNTLSNQNSTHVYPSARSLSSTNGHLPSSHKPSTSSNIPVETYLGETQTAYIVFVRVIPGTSIQLFLESRSLLIRGILPPLPLPEDGVEMDPMLSHFERRIQFPSAITSSPCTKVMNHATSTLTVQIPKFKPLDMGTEIFWEIVSHVPTAGR